MKPQSPLRAALGQALEDKTLVSSFFIAILLIAADLGAEITSPAPSLFKLVLRGGALAFLAFALTYYLVREYRNNSILHAEKPIPLVFAVDCTRHQGLNALRTLQDNIRAETGFSQFQQVEQQFNVRYEDLLAHRTEALPPDPAVWREFLGDSQQDIRQFLDHVPGRRVYHVAVRGPSALALGVGALLSTKYRTVAYHFDAGIYSPVLDLVQGPRQVKTWLDEPDTLKFVTVDWPGSLAPDTAVALDLASHLATGGVQRYLSKWSQPYSLVRVTNTYRGHLPAESWMPLVQEIFSVFNRLQRDPVVERIHLFFSMPVGLALGLGMALGNFIPVVVYNWERAQETYFPVMHLNHIDSLL